MRVHNKWVWSLGQNHDLEFGGLVEKQEGVFDFALNTRYGPLANPIQQQSSLNRMLEVDRDGTEWSAYISMTSSMKNAITMRFVFAMMSRVSALCIQRG